MRIQKKFRVDAGRSSFFIAVLVAGAVLAVGGSVLATTVGNNISVTGTTAVSGTGTSTFVGGASAASLTSFSGITVGGGNITATSSALTIQVGNGNNLLLNPSSVGLIGIGTTSPSSLLSIGPASMGSGGLFYNGALGIATSSPGAAFAIATTTVGANTTFLVSNLGTGYTAWFEDSANDQSPTVINAAGNVGIGTTTPGTAASIQGVANFVDASVATSTIYAKLQLPSLLATSTIATSTFSNGLLVGTTAGSVGVGTTTPFKTLSITGSGLFGNTTGTTTVSLSSNGAAGSCIEMRAASSSTMYRIYLGSSFGSNVYASTSPLIVEVGSCGAQAWGQ